MQRRTFLSLPLATSLPAAAAASPFHRAEFIFPQESWHNHSSSIVELPGGELFVCWFHGSGERQADDVKIMAARRPKDGQWSAPFELADTPGFPDTNPVLFVDSRRRLWLMWPAILANQWETALMKYKVSSDYSKPGVPKWADADNILIIPKNMVERTTELFKRDLRPTPFGQYASRMVAMASDKLTSRLGWFTRTHPIELASGRIIVPMYSDGYSFSIMAISDDGGKTWTGSEPIVGYGNIQPALVQKKDGSLVAFMRDAGPPPKRIHMSISKDQGMSWSIAEDTQMPNPGSSVEAITLRDGSWLMVSNDTEKGRNSLLTALSDDEGATWKWKRHLERHDAGQYHYPSAIQAADGTIHATYSFFQPQGSDGKQGKTIKHAHFNVDWVKEGDRA